MVRGSVFTTRRMRGLVLAVLVAGLVAASPVFGRGDSNSGNDVVLVNQTFECSSYKQPVDFDLVKVTINLPNGRVDAIHTGPSCTGRIGRIEVDTWNADGVKVHPGTHDLVIDGGYVRCHGRVGAVHQDGIQAMGGQRVTFKNVTVDCATATNGAMFIAQGAGAREIPTDIICDGCTLMKGPTRNRVLRIATSIRSGARNSTIVWCGHGPGCGEGEAVWQTSTAVQPVDENNRIVLYSDRNSTSPPPPNAPPTLVLRSFKLSSSSPKPGVRLVGVLGVSGLTPSDPSEAICRASVAGRAVGVSARSAKSGVSRCTFVIPATARPGHLLTGIVGLKNGRSTVNRSFTIRIAGATRPAAGGRIAEQLQPVASGISVRRFVISNRAPAAGSRLYATVTLAGFQGGGPETLKCAGIASGKALQTIGSALKSPNATCAWRIPTDTQGETLDLSLSVMTPAGAIFTQSFGLNVRA